MKIKYITYFLKNIGKSFAFILFLFCINKNVLAQTASPFTSKTDIVKADSVKKNPKKKEKIDYSVELNYATFNSTNHFKLDTNITTIHRDKYLLPSQYNIGNYGSSYNDFIYHAPTNPSIQLGINANTRFNYVMDSLRFYKTSKAFTQMNYMGGSGKLAGIEVLHTQNLNPNTNLFLAYTKLGSTGVFSIQKTNQDHGAISLGLLSKKVKNYSSKIGLLYNKLQQDENGGIAADSFLNSLYYGIKSTIPVKYPYSTASVYKSSISNMYRNVQLQWQNTYVLTYTQKDTTKTPSLTAIYTLLYNAQKYRYKDQSADSLRYVSFDNIRFTSTDTVQNVYTCNTFTNELGLQIPTIKNTNVQLDANYGLDIEHIKSTQAYTYIQNQYEHVYINNYVKANLANQNPQHKWQYKADAKLYFTGLPKGNYALNGMASRSISNYKIIVSASQLLSSQSYLMQYYASYKQNEQNNFTKQFSNTAKIELQNSALHFVAGMQYSSVVNFLYWDSTLQAKQYSNLLSVQHFYIQKLFSYKHFSLDNAIHIQIKNTNAPVNIPPYYSIHRLAYNNQIFHKKMSASTGLDISYHSPFYSAGYSPLLNNFVYSTNYKANNLPRIMAFFNFKVSRFASYVAVDEVLQSLSYIKGFSVTNRIVSNQYAMPNVAFKFGFSWQMIN